MKYAAADWNIVARVDSLHVCPFFKGHRHSSVRLWLRELLFDVEINQ